MFARIIGTAAAALGAAVLTEALNPGQMSHVLSQWAQIFS